MRISSLQEMTEKTPILNRAGGKGKWAAVSGLCAAGSGQQAARGQPSLNLHPFFTAHCPPPTSHYPPRYQLTFFSPFVTVAATFFQIRPKSTYAPPALE